MSARQFVAMCCDRVCTLFLFLYSRRAIRVFDIAGVFSNKTLFSSGSKAPNHNLSREKKFQVFVVSDWSQV